MSHAASQSSDALAQLCQALEQRLSADQYSVRYTDRIAYARDQWPRSLIKLRQGQLETPPDIIIWPETPQEAADALALCQETAHATPAIAAGGGSAVTGATSPMRGGAIIDVKRLNQIRWIDLDRGLAEIEAGVLGMHLEEALKREGATLGHFPSSIMCSTLGGWAAARSAGQGSSRYGKIEDMIEDIELASPDGQVRWVKGRLDPTPLLVGSEGRLGLFTACRVKIHPAPAARSFRGVLFPSVAAGLDAIQAMMQSGDVPPTILRLYDPVDTGISSHKRAKEDPDNRPARRSDGVLLPSQSQALVAVKPEKTPRLKALRKRFQKGLLGMAKPILSQAFKNANASMGLIDAVMSDASLMILGCEGHHKAAADALLKRHLQRAIQAGGEDLGPGPGWHWFDGRYNVSFKQSTVFLNGAFSDTMEVVARWPQVLPLYHKVRKAIQQDAVVMAHFSHAYPEGCSIYFSFAAISPEAKELETYDRIWQRGLAAAASVGAGVSHHHGIGFSKAHAMELEWGKGGMQMMRALRAAFDPDNHLNPGKLDLDPTPSNSGGDSTTTSSDELLETLKDAQPHLPWDKLRPNTDEELWERYGTLRDPGLHTLTLHDWHEVQTLLQSCPPSFPLYTSKGPTPDRAGWHIDLPLPADSPPSFQLDQEAMLLTCDSRFSLDAIESYARMFGFTTGLRSDAPFTLREWIDQGHPHLSEVSTIFMPAQVYGITALLPSGQEVQCGRGPRASSGPDIRHLFWQSGGAFGIVKRATLRLRKVISDVLVWRTVHQSLPEVISLLRELFGYQQPPLQMALRHDLPEGPFLLSIRFCPESAPAIVERYHQIPKVQELSALPTPPLPNTPWWLAVSGDWSDLPDLARLLRTQAPWPLMRLHLVHASHVQGTWLASYSPSTESSLLPKAFGSFVQEVHTSQLTKGLWGDPRFVHAPSLDPTNAALYQRVKRGLDPHARLNSHALGPLAAEPRP